MSISGGGEGQPVSAHFLRLSDHLRGVQERLGWDAADIETDTAKPLPIVDKHDLHAEVGGAERGAVPARPGTEHQQLAMDIAALGHRRPGHWRWCGRSLLLSGCRFTGTQFQDGVSGGHGVADVHLDRDDRAGRRGGHVHGGLVRLQRDQRVIDGDGVAGVDKHLDDRYCVEVADVWDGYLDLVVNPARGAITGLLTGIRMPAFVHMFLGRQARRPLSLQDHKHSSLRNAVPDRDPQFGDGAGRRGGHIHRGFVRLERDQRVVDSHSVTGIDVDLDHRHVAEVADVGDRNFNSAHVGFLASFTGEAGGRLRGSNTAAG